MSFLKKFQRNRKSSETGSFGSSLSIQSVGTNKGLLNTTYSVNEKELPTFLKAIWRNDIPKVKKLIKKYYNIVDKERRSGLHLACAMGCEELVREFLGNYCNEILEKKDSNNRTGLFKAVEAGSLPCVRLLIEKGAKTDIRDDNGDTIVHAAIKYKHFEVLQYLLHSHCSSNQLNNAGFAPLHLAASADYIEGIDALLQHDVDINQLTSSNKTSLILAAESGHYNLIKELLSRNADFRITDNDGNDAHYYADFHQYSDCAQQLQSATEYSKTKTPPRRPTPLQMPEFIVSQSPDSRELLGSSSKNSVKLVSRVENSDKKKEFTKTEDMAKKSPVKKERQHSLKSENSWSDDFSHYSSDTTLPNIKSKHLHDISTPSSMPNPSEASSQIRPMSNGVYKTPLSKQHSDEEESQWTDTDANNDSVEIPFRHIKNNLGLQTQPVKKENVVEVIRNDDSDWDSNTENDEGDPDAVLSTIDEESGSKQNGIGSSKVRLKKSKLMKLSDGHQTDSNIDDCYNTNYMFLNQPVRYDSSETLEKSIDYDDDDTELSQTKIPNPNYRGEIVAPLSKPPVSPMNKTDNQPMITIEGPSSKGTVGIIKPVHGDNLSYSSTDLSSRRESLAGSDVQTDVEKFNAKSIEDYIRKCSNLESKLRIIESEKDILQQDAKRLGESKKKIEVEKTKLQKDYQKIELILSEKNSETEELKSRLVISDELLKNREKELFEMKKSNQELIGNLNEKEMKNIAYDSKNKQLQQEITNLQTELQRTTHSEKDVEYQKSQFEIERDALQKKNEELCDKISDLNNQISKSQVDYDKTIVEKNSTIKNYQDQIQNLTKTIDVNREDDLNRIEEIEQLKKTISNLNADLESSNKSAALVAKEEQKNKKLSEELKIEERKLSDLRNEIQNLRTEMADSEQVHNRSKQECDRLRSQLSIVENNLSQLELKHKSSESQAKEFQKLLEMKISELKDLNRKCLDLDEAVTTERNSKDHIVEKVNLAINSAISQCPDSEDVLEQLRNVRKSLNGFDTNLNSAKMSPSTPYKGDLDSSIELSKARSQIRVLQDQLDDVRKGLTQTKDEVFAPKRYLPLQSHDVMDNNYESEMDRVNKIEQIEKENQNDLKDQTRILRQTQQQEKQKTQLLKENEMSLITQLNNSVKSNKTMMDNQEALKQIFNRFNKQFPVEDRRIASLPLDLNSSGDNSNGDLPLLFTKLLQQMADSVDELKIKNKKIEMEKTTMEEEYKCQENKRDTMVENSKLILSQQLSEVTQMMDNQRMNREKLEKIRDECEFQVRNELYRLRQANLIEVSELNQLLARAERDRDELIQEVKLISDQLLTERNLKNQLTEQLVNIIRIPSGPIPQMSGSREFQFPNANTVNNTSSQWNIPNSIIETDRKPFSISMSNLSMLKTNGVEDEELRQRMRKELDRSIAKHLESGKPIRQLNVKDKIRSLNVSRYPGNNVTWKAQ